MVEEDSFKAKVISGEVFGVKGPIDAKTPTYFLDFTMLKGKVYDHLIPAGWTAMVIVHNGTLALQEGTSEISKGSAAVFTINPSHDEYLRF